jgi:hypothetical protein
MLHWNYRILAKKVSDEVQYGIHEVHYEDDIPVGCTENPVYPITFGDEGDPIENLKWQLDAIKLALEKPILDYDNFPKVYTKYYRKKKLEVIKNYE